MMYRGYVANIVREHRVLFAFAFAFVGLFQVLIITLVVGADLLGSIELFFRQMPPQVQVMFGEQFMAQFSVSGAVAFGYNHPLVLVMLSLVAILLPARHVAGEIEAGTLELLFTLPVKRHGVALSLWFSSAMVLLGLVAGCWAGTAWGFYLYPEARVVSFSIIVKVGLSLWLLMTAVSSYTLLIAAYAREGGQATLRAAVLTLTFYFLNLAVVMWPAVDVLQPFTLFHYHQPQSFMRGEPLLGVNAAVLGGVALLCGGWAVRRVSRRDIPG